MRNCSRIVADIYAQIWRYGGVVAYLRLILSDAVALGVCLLINAFLPVPHIGWISLFSVVSLNLLLAVLMRICYYCVHSLSNEASLRGKISRGLLRVFAHTKPKKPCENKSKEAIGIAIVGAGRIGVGLATELASAPSPSYRVCCFIDKNPDKIGRNIAQYPVFSEKEITPDSLRELGVREIVFAISSMEPEKRKELYNKFKSFGFRVMVYDYPTFRTAASGKRNLREFDIEELLFRKPIEINDEQTCSYYRDKVILITGGGGSIGSELARQIAKMQPKKLILLDVYENGAYEVQQELKSAYKDDLDLSVEILSVCNRPAMERVFATYRPQIVLNAAAHKHVPLMEHNCVEAVENNVFGTLNTVELSEKYGAERFLMVSTDKAVNPTNVMGATKRMCEMIVQSHAASSETTAFCATRFGNVLGSAGSVIPLFKRQISAGGPVTVTDKRIIRYFMTIPEASQLVLQSGAMSKSGELFVLDMGKPVKILELAENMIRLSGFEPYDDIDIIETGLRPGEKLYEELLIRTEELSRTENDLIFIERDRPLSAGEIAEKIELLRAAIETGDDQAVRDALYCAVPTFRPPSVVNGQADTAPEMHACAASETGDSPDPHSGKTIAAGTLGA